MTTRQRVAIVHDALINTGGAERVVTFMMETFPDAPIYTSAYVADETYPIFRSAAVFTLPGAGFVHNERRCKQLFPLWIMGFRHLDLSQFDVIVSSTTWGAKFVKSAGRHVCYCYAPFRAAWKSQAYAATSDPYGVLRMKGVLGMALIRLASAPLRSLDYKAMQAVSRIATTCRNMADEIASIYHRQAQVIYAPIRVADYHLAESEGEYYLMVSRLMSYKRVDLAVEACEVLGRKLLVVGEGPEKRRLITRASERATQSPIASNAWIGRASRVSAWSIWFR